MKIVKENKIPELYPFANFGIFEQILKTCHYDIENII